MATDILASFTLATATLLGVPGPSNALVANCGIRGGYRAVWLTVPAVIIGYAIIVGLLIFGVGDWLAAHPIIARTLRVCCALYLLKVAYSLWTTAPQTAASDRAGIGLAGQFRAVLIVTLLNPKGLVAGLVLIPSYVGTPQDHKVALILICLFIAIAGLFTTVYTLAGGMIYSASGTSNIKNILSRASAVVILGFAGIIFYGAF